MNKRSFYIVLILVLSLSIFFVGCGKKDPLIPENATKLVVAASPTPHAQILEQCKPLMEEKGYELEVKEFTDYVQPNLATENGDVDANYFQHTPYLVDFNKNEKTHLVSVGVIHYEPFGIYAGKVDNLETKTGLKIAVPNDSTNETRALLLLQQEGFITLKDGVTSESLVTKLDIVETNGNEIIELEAAAIASTRADNDLVVLNGNYALSADLSVKDALAIEAADSDAANVYGNILVVHECNKDNKLVKALLECLQSETIKNYINNTFEGSVVPKF